MRVERITAQAFRGYPGRVDIVLGGDVVLLFGENGTGKTSLTEAFEWALFGSIVRKARSKTPGEYRAWAWIRNVHAEPEMMTLAEVELVDEDGHHHVVRRQLDGNATVLTVDGAAATDITALGLRTEDAFRPFLGQCEIQALIDSEQQDRWEQLSSILGFGQFGEVRRRLQRMRTDADHDDRVQRTREISQRAVQPLTREGTDPLAASPASLRDRAAAFLKLEDGAGWAEIAEAATRQLDELYKLDRRPRGLDRLLVGPEETRAAFDSLRAATGALQQQAGEHRRWHIENARSSFAQQGLALIDAKRPDECPFCGKQTLTAPRLAEISRQSEDSTPRPPDHRREFQDAQIALTGAGPTDLDVVAQVLNSLGEGQPERVLADRVADEQRELQVLKERFRGLAEGLLAATDRASRPSGDPAPLASLGDQIDTAGAEIVDRYAAVRVSAEQLMSSLIQRFTALSEEDRSRLAALQKAKLLAENAGAIEAAWRVRELQAALANLVADLETAEKERMAAALQTLSEDTARYYEEMSPGHHIRITGITVRDTKRRQAALEATSHGTKVNPVTTFSEAEGNCLGLGLYFSQRVDRNPGWSMIMLDDPVQSMDEGHEEGLIHLLTRISRKRQVVVMTHSRRFANQLHLQFSGLDSYARYDLERGSGPEPEIRITAGRFDELLRFAEDNARGEEVRREACAGAIRKAVERFCRDLAAKHNQKLKTGSVAVTDLIDKIHTRGLIDELEAGTLRRLGRFGSRGAHDDEQVNPTESSILANIGALKELYAKCIAPERPALRLVQVGFNVKGA
jgi:hypothetical protein